MIRYYITDRLRLGGTVPLIRNVERQARRVDWLQVREKDMSARDLLALVQQLIGIGPEIIVNGRVDIALAAGAHGVHLPARSIAVSRWRRIVPSSFRIGVSCHSVLAVEEAAGEGADYALLAPIFATPSKPGYGPPLGLDTLRKACAAVSIPVLALGGVDESRADEIIDAGAAGFAAVTAFQTSE
jgi:thiamine-phosphate pyrophosphorylase